jgi:antitoxin component of MazEF toxin-antitoxin module
MHKAIRIIRRIGNSQGIIIPKEMMNALEWDVGDNVIMKVQDGALYIEYTKAAGKSKYFPGLGFEDDDE